MKTFEQVLEDFSVNDINPSSNARELLAIEKGSSGWDEQILKCKDALQFSKDDIVALTKLISSGHPGFQDFPKEVQENFLAEMEALYTGKTQRTPDNVWAALEKLPDNHLQCAVIQKDGKEQSVYYHEGPTEEEVGRNLMPRRDDTDKINFGGIKYINEGKTAVIMMPNTGNTSDMSKVEKFLDDFNAMMAKADNLDNIILDIRSNPGGATFIHEYIARRLYGNEVAKCDLETTRATKEGAYILRKTQEIPATKVDEYAQSEQIFSEGRGYLAKYPAFERGGFKKPIFTLQNRETASAAEGFVYMMKNHPNAITIGSNTAGCVTYAGRKKVFLNNGFGVKIPFSKQVYTDQNGKQITVEGKGFEPDIRTSGDAYDFVINPSNAEIIKEILENKKTTVSRRLNEEEKNQLEGTIPRISSMKELTQSNTDIDATIKPMFEKIHADLNPKILDSLLSFAKACKSTLIETLSSYSLIQNVKNKSLTVSTPQILQDEKYSLTEKALKSGISISINNKLER